MLASVGVLVLALAVLSVGFNLLLASRLSADASAVLRSRAAAQQATITFRDGRIRAAEPPNDAALDHEAWVFVAGRAVEHPDAAPPAVRAVARTLARTSRPRERTVGDGARLLAVPLRDSRGALRGTLVVGISLEPYRHTRHLALIASAVLSALLLLAAAIAVRFAVRAALRPVGEMTARAADWSEHDLHRRFHLGPPRDELTALAFTFDELLRRIEAVLRHEQRFSAEMAHELRTPLTTVRGEVEIALARGSADPDDRDTLERVHEATARMETVIDTLLSSARAAEGGPPGSCDPMPPIREAIQAIGPAAESSGVSVRLTDGHAALTVDAEPSMVSQTLLPLLENAVRHARSRVDVSVSADDRAVSVTVGDDGPGLQVADAFEPGVSTTGGAGLGLPLARRLARGCGGDVSAARLPGRTQFALTLPGGPRT